MPVPIEAIRKKTPAQIQADVAGFAARYVQDWNAWLRADADARPELFGRILRKWQAARPGVMRRLKREAHDEPYLHDGPYLDELLESAKEPLGRVAGLSVLTIAKRTSAQSDALHSLWKNFLRLRTTDDTTCVGITKAILLLTDGRIGPAFDSQVRQKLGVARPANCAEWLKNLEEIGEDIAAFERVNGAIAKVVPPEFAELAYGRLYDMALGPR
jgi:hypothetical protein